MSKRLQPRCVVVSLEPAHWNLLDQMTQAQKCSMRDLVSSIVREVCHDDLVAHDEVKSQLHAERYQ